MLDAIRGAYLLLLLRLASAPTGPREAVADWFLVGFAYAVPVLATALLAWGAVRTARALARVLS